MYISQPVEPAIFVFNYLLSFFLPPGPIFQELREKGVLKNRQPTSRLWLLQRTGDDWLTSRGQARAIRNRDYIGMNKRSQISL